MRQIDGELGPTLKKLSALAQDPPGVILLEGGSEEKRLSTALHWAKLLNCREGTGAPCLKCAVCKQIDSGEFLDLWQFDGRIQNKEDEENPGLVRALRIDNIRAVKAAIGIRPHGEGKRVVIIQGMQITREEALNTLLKTLEEPGDFTSFLLLTPQREQILPTLVSRSLCITLPWEDSGQQNGAQASSWEDALAEFIERGGSGFLEALSQKGKMDAIMAADLLKGCQRAIARIFTKQTLNRLDKALTSAASSPEKVFRISRWILEGQEMLQLGVAPQRVLEALGSQIYSLRFGA